MDFKNDSNKPYSPENPKPALAPTSTNKRTMLPALDEALFKAWTKANGVEDNPNYDLRGFYKETHGKVHPPGTIDYLTSILDHHLGATSTPKV